jgi:hypothetical protein
MRYSIRSGIQPIIAVCLFAGCATPPPAPPPAPKVSFSWSKPGTCATSGSVPVTFAIVHPRFVSVAGTGSMLDGAATRNYQLAAWMKPRQDMYDEFAASMRNDFLALLSCKGFTTKGPFTSYEEMVFPDRVGSDLILAPELDLRVRVQSEPVPPSFGSALLGAALRVNTSPDGAKLKGQATISGRITLSIRESVTDTRMWTRSIEVPSETFEFVSAREYPPTAAMLYDEIVTGDPAFLEALGPKLLAVYGKALSAAWNYTSPQEMRLVKSQSQDPRKRAVSGMSR